MKEILATPCIAAISLATTKPTRTTRRPVARRPRAKSEPSVPLLARVAARRDGSPAEPMIAAEMMASGLSCRREG